MKNLKELRQLIIDVDGEDGIKYVKACQSILNRVELTLKNDKYFLENLKKYDCKLEWKINNIILVGNNHDMLMRFSDFIDTLSCDCINTIVSHYGSRKIFRYLKNGIFYNNMSSLNAIHPLIPVPVPVPAAEIPQPAPTPVQAPQPTPVPEAPQHPSPSVSVTATPKRASGDIPTPAPEAPQLIDFPKSQLVIDSDRLKAFEIVKKLKAEYHKDIIEEVKSIL